MFADLFEDVGRRSVPPIVAVVIVLQRIEGCSDRPAGVTCPGGPPRAQVSVAREPGAVALRLVEADRYLDLGEPVLSRFRGLAASREEYFRHKGSIRI